MTPADRFNRVCEVFEYARRLDRDQRNEYLNGIDDDTSIRSEVAKLLRQHDQAEGVLDQPVPAQHILSATQEAKERNAAPIPERIGQFRISSVLGEGGMGIVYLAEQDNPQRHVALKVVRPGVGGRQLLRRFELETIVLARLMHPGIAQIFEAGTYDDGRGGRPFFAMEYVQGKRLTDYVRDKGTGTRDKLEMLARVCDAVHHAHKKGVVHRDLKPGNILVDTNGQPKILDFGVARLTDSDVQVTTMRTDMRQLIGTMPYMSPEQIEGDPHNVDTRADIYALGVIAYELLANRLPYELTDRTLAGAARVICEDDPTSLRTHERSFRGDLDTMVGKALEKDPDRRYQSVSAFAADIRRFLSNEPISARPSTTLYQIGKFARRNKGLVGGIIAAFVFLLAGIVVSAMFAIGMARASKLEKQRADELETVAAFQAAQLSNLNPHAMGAQLRNDIIAQAIDASSEEDVVALQSTLGPINFTDVALRLLNASLFERALQTVNSEFADQPLVRAELLQSLSDTMNTLGLLKRAETPLLEALDIRRDMLGDEDPKTLQSTDSMGVLLSRIGKLHEAGDYHAEALAGRRRVLGAEHPDSLISLMNAALVQKQLGEFQQAETKLAQVYDSARNVLGRDHWLTLQAANSLASTLEGQDKSDDALRYYTLALEGRSRTLGEEHPDTLTSVNNMGAFLQRRKQYEDALPFCQRAYETRKRVLGSTHPNTLVSATNMAASLQSLKRLNEARELGREILRVRRDMLGNHHPDTLLSANNLAIVLYHQQVFGEAAILFREALEGRQRVLGPAHPRTVNTAKSLARTLAKNGGFTEAEEILVDSFDATAAAHGEGAPGTIRFMNTMVFFYDSWHSLEPEAGHDVTAEQWKQRRAAAVE